MAVRPARARLSKTSLRLALAGMALLTLIAAIIIPALQAGHRASTERYIEARLLDQLHTRTAALTAKIKSSSTDLQLLAGTPPVQGILRALDHQGRDPQDNSSLDDWKRRLAAIFAAYARTHPDVSQVRYIGIADEGRELVRVDRTDQGIHIVPGEDLQSKAHRAYFRQTLLRAPGGIYVSDINLNREHGAVAVPHEPTLRLAIPVFDPAQRIRGMLVINLKLARELLRFARTESDRSMVFLLNSDGDYLVHPNPARSFGFDLGQRWRWEDEYTSEEPFGRQQSNRLQQYRDSTGKLLHAVHQRILHDPLDTDRHLRVIAAAPESLIAAMTDSARRSASLILIPLGLLVAGFLALINLVIRRGQEASLNQARLAAIVDSSSDAIIATDHWGRIESWNHAAELMFQHSHAQAVGASIKTLLTPDHLHHEMEVLLQRVSQGEKVAAFDTIRQRRDGSLVDVSISASAIPGNDRETAGLAFIVHDISAHKRAEARILKMNATLEQQVSERTRELVVAKDLADQANAAKSEFLANMSHEIRTPMNAVQGMLQLLERTPLNDQQADYVDKASSAGSSLLHIIDEILDYSKIEAGKLTLHRESFTVGQLLKDVAVVAGGNVGAKPVELLFDVDPALPPQLLGDEHRLRQVLINLMGNAVKFTSEGEVLLSLKLLRRDEDQVRVRFSIKDSGIGMSTEQQARIFDAFVQADAGTTRRFGGTGLGLVICQRLIGMMGGRLEVLSEPDIGSEFFFTLNLDVGAGQAHPREFQVEAIAALRDLHVLSVDDNAMALQVSQSILSTLGWRCETAADGAGALQAIEHAKQQDEPFDVIFLDWRMPEMDGWETARRIRRLFAEQQPVIIMVSAYTKEAYAQFNHDEKHLIDRMLMKPLTRSSVFDAVVSCRANSGDRHGAAEQHKGTRLQGVRILVAEDNVTNQQVACELLNSEGAVTTIAENGLAAVQAVREQSFDIVLMDIQMPEMDGLTAARTLRDELAFESPILAMTANVLPRDLEQSRAAGMNGHIGKPFDFENLVTTILQQINDEPAPDQGPAEPFTGQDAGLEDGCSIEEGDGHTSEVRPDYDFTSALARMGGRESLYARTIRQFLMTPPLKPSEFRSLLSANRIDEALRALHNLKGVSGTLGAMALSRHCGAFEARLQAGEDHDWSTELKTLEQLLQRAAEHLDREARRIETQASPPVPATERRSLTEMLNELDKLLGQSNMRAMDVFAEIRGAEPAIAAATLDALDASLRSLDFPAAQLIVRGLLKNA